MNRFKVIIVEDVPLELKGTLGIIRNDIPEAEVIGTADNEAAYWKLLKQQKPDLLLLDLGLGGSTTVGVEICRSTKEMHPDIKVLIFTGEILNEKLWVDVLDAGADGIILKTGELLTRGDVNAVMEGKTLVFNEPILEKIVERFKQAVSGQLAKQESLVNYAMNDGEISRITAAERPEVAFIRLWTMKEARLKLTGEGITNDLKTALADSHRYRFTTVEQLDRNYIYTVCEER